MEILPACQVLLTQDGHILRANRAFRKLLEEVQGELPPLEGTRLDAWLTPNANAPLLNDVLDCVASQEHLEILPVSIAGSGRLAECHIYPLPLESEKARVFWVLVEEVTRQRVIEEQLKQAERLASIGELSANLAHELNSPLDGALRYLQFLLEDLGEDDPRRRYALYIQDGLQRMARIVKGLLHFARQSPRSLEPLDVPRALEDVLQLLEPDLNKRAIRVEKHFDPDLPVLLCRDLEHVFLNVIKNAVQAMPDGGTLTLRTRLEFSRNRPEKWVCIEIEDTGHGIPWEIQNKVFSPFFTTKDVGEGTGLGLSISRGIVERYHGSIHLESRLNQGTRVTIRIPLQESECPSNSAPTRGRPGEDKGSPVGAQPDMREG